jgi:D-3-phosphoglycerate dehydrogenase / 2-oxoglutarate reductase
MSPKLRSRRESTTTRSGRKLTILDFEGYRPWDAELEAARKFGLQAEIVEYSKFRAVPQRSDVLVNSWAYPLPASLLEQIEGCSLIVGFGTGVDHTDLAAARSLGIDVVNTPGLNVEDVATHALALMLACTRQVLLFDAAVRSGSFYGVDGCACHRLLGRTLGLLAFGNIARRLRELVRPFDMRVISFDPGVPEGEMQQHGVERVSLEELLGLSDVLSIHAPETPETRGLLSDERLRLLRPGAIVLAMGRGSVYDAQALATALVESRIAAAGLDVFPEEPLPLGHPLLRAPRTVLTPHCAGDSAEAVTAYHLATVEAVTAWADGKRPANVVN